jgi:hypothetical protein
VVEGDRCRLIGYLLVTHQRIALVGPSRDEDDDAREEGGPTDRADRDGMAVEIGANAGRKGADCVPRIAPEAIDAQRARQAGWAASEIEAISVGWTMAVPSPNSRLATSHAAKVRVSAIISRLAAWIHMLSPASTP